MTSNTVVKQQLGAQDANLICTHWDVENSANTRTLSVGSQATAWCSDCETSGKFCQQNSIFMSLRAILNDFFPHCVGNMVNQSCICGAPRWQKIWTFGFIGLMICVCFFVSISTVFLMAALCFGDFFQDLFTISVVECIRYIIHFSRLGASWIWVVLSFLLGGVVAFEAYFFNVEVCPNAADEEKLLNIYHQDGAWDCSCWSKSWVVGYCLMANHQPPHLTYAPQKY